MIRNASLDPSRVPGAATPAEVVGRVATRDIRANTPIPREALQQEGKLAIRVPVGMRAISIDTTAEIAVASSVRATGSMSRWSIPARMRLQARVATAAAGLPRCCRWCRCWRWAKSSSVLRSRTG
ncbi:hypothetical protein ACFSLT_27655 [Novosphingobium resinovorum]